MKFWFEFGCVSKFRASEEAKEGYYAHGVERVCGVAGMVAFGEGGDAFTSRVIGFLESGRKMKRKMKQVMVSGEMSAKG